MKFLKVKDINGITHLVNFNHIIDIEEHGKKTRIVSINHELVINADFNTLIRLISQGTDVVIHEIKTN